ncbi:iron-containing redox enzyme family protein [Sorangium sp. So ce388]|uniref:iron-containing redox enzyme family protein n=1 Tax=Sorangium sp. So ce388 TaxID=3133309 RepID=UPI003F5BA036
MIFRLDGNVVANNTYYHNETEFQKTRGAFCMRPVAGALCAGALGCGNLLYLLSKHRCYADLAVGALAVTELAVPKRFERIMRATRRLGLPPEVAAYCAAHVEADGDHAAGWLSGVVAPRVHADPRVVPVIATGVMLRLETSNAYCDQIFGALRGLQTRPRLTS